MNKYLKIIPYILVVIVAIVVALVQPWQYIPFIPIIGQNSALTVKTIAGRAEVFIDDKKIGDTPLSSENLKPGSYNLTIKRVSDVEGFYQDLLVPIHLEDNTRTFVEAEIGPSEQFSSIVILYYKKNKSDISGFYINTNPSEANIWIDDIREGLSPLTTSKLNEGRHEIKISKEGYEDIETTIIIRKGYTLIADIRLMSKPIELD